MLILDDVLPLGPHPLDLVPAPQVRSVQGIEADLYVPAWGGRHPGIILVNGVVEEGRKYPALVGAAGALARGGYTVLVPELGGQRSLRFRPESVDDLVAAIAAMQRQPEVRSGPVGLYGFSLGGSVALLAAEDPRTRGMIAFVGDLGGYYRLTDIVRAATTGSVPDGERVSLDPVVVYAAITSVIDLIPPGPDQILLQQTLKRGTQEDWLAPFAALQPQQLSPPAQRLLALVQNRDGSRVDALLDALDPSLLTTLDALSPAAHLERLSAPVWALHDRHDPFVPSVESRLLAQDPRGHGQVRLLETTLLTHTEFLDLPKFTPKSALDVYIPNLLRLERFLEEPLARL